MTMGVVSSTTRHALMEMFVLCK